MAKQYSEIPEKIRLFIQEQKIFFVATAAVDGRINLSPKGMDSLRVVDGNRVVWLNMTGSGNETAAHLLENSRMTLMFMAFTGDPLILRLYGTATAIHKKDPEWSELYSLFPENPGARQLFDLNVDLVQTSCGMAVPLYEYVDDRRQLIDWAEKKGEAGVSEYWVEKNQHSIDGKPTHIVEKNL